MLSNFRHFAIKKENLLVGKTYYCNMFPNKIKVIKKVSTEEFNDIFTLALSKAKYGWFLAEYENFNGKLTQNWLKIDDYFDDNHPRLFFENEETNILCKTECKEEILKELLK